MRRCTIGTLPALFALLLLFAFSASRSSAQPEFRAFWADAFHTGFKKASDVDELMAATRASHCNALVVQVRKRGDSYYVSSYEPTATDMAPGFDALAYIIQKAHNESPRIEVHAWIATLPISSSTDPRSPFVKYPQFLSKDVNGKLIDGTDYIIDPGHPGALDYTANIALDIVRNYDVDGIHMDRVRFGSANWGYNDTSVARFNSIVGGLGKPEPSNESWKQWRRDQVSALMRKIYANAIALKPQIKVSASTITWSSGPADDDVYRAKSSAYTSVFQDWRSWMEEGILDINMPMCYDREYDADQYQYYRQWLTYLKDHKFTRHLVVGNGIYMNTVADSITQLWEDRNMTAAGNKADGAVMYSYAVTNNEFLDDTNSPDVPNSDFFNALVNSSSYSSNPPFPDVVPLPEMPWKTHPVTGHLKGNISANGLWVDGARVSISGPENRTQTADGTGFYAFIDLTPGTYSVSVLSSVGSRTSPVTVTAGNMANLDFAFTAPAPTIWDVVVSNVGPSGFTVSWMTDPAATSQVQFGTTRALGSATEEDKTPISIHSTTLTGLTGLTPYYFRVVANASSAVPVYSPIYCAMTSFGADIIVDNNTPGATWMTPSDADWSVGTGSNKYGDDYRFCSTLPEGGSTFEWRPNLPISGNYTVYVSYPSGTNRSSAAPFTVNYSGGATSRTVNQTIAGTGFEANSNTSNVRLTTTSGVPFVAGTSGSVVLSNAAPSGKVVMADAVKFRLVIPERNPPSVPSGIHTTMLGSDRITLAWNDSSDASGIGGYKVYRDGTLTGVSMVEALYADDGLIANRAYTYAVSAFDVYATPSAQSAPVAIRTASIPPSYSTVTANKTRGAWMADPNVTFTAVGGFGEGTLSYYRTVWDQNTGHTWTGAEATWNSGTLTKTATSGSAGWYLHLQGYNAANIANGTLDFGPFYFNNTVPGAVTVTDDGAYTISRTQFHATWTAVDSGSGISGYRYAVGTSKGAVDLIGWTDTTSNSATVTVPQRPYNGKVFFSVRAKSSAGLLGAAGDSDGIMVARPITTVLEAKRTPVGTAVMITSAKQISAAFTDCLYVQDTVPPIGIRVNAKGGAANRPGIVAGIVGYEGGELGLLEGQVTLQAGSVAAKPLNIPARGLGGADLPGLQPGSVVQRGIVAWHWVKLSNGTLIRQCSALGGPNNIGLLVRTWGKVSNTGSGYFYLDDGSACDETDTGNPPGIKVVVVPGTPIPAKGSFVCVRAIIACYESGGRMFRLLKPINTSCVAVLKGP